MKLLRALACAATLAFVLASSAAAQPALTSIKVGIWTP
jgi:hypothetical protein